MATGFSSLGKKLARIGQDTKNGVQKMSDSVSINSRISAEKKSLGRLFAVIGEAVYKENPDVPKEGLEDEYAAVKVAYANIENLTKQLDQMNGIIYCPNCGKPADKGDKFCAKCGARLFPKEETGGGKLAQDIRDAGSEVGKIAGNAADKTGEFFGSAAAKTKNGIGSIADRSRKFWKNASGKFSRKKDSAEESGEEESIDLGEDFDGADPDPESAPDSGIPETDFTGTEEEFTETEEGPEETEVEFTGAEEDALIREEQPCPDADEEAEVPAEETEDGETPEESAPAAEESAQAAEESAPAAEEEAQTADGDAPAAEEEAQAAEESAPAADEAAGPEQDAAES